MTIKPARNSKGRFVARKRSARRRNPPSKSVLAMLAADRKNRRQYRGETLEKDAFGKWELIGHAWGDGPGEVHRFRTLAAGKAFIDRMESQWRRNPGRKAAAPSHDLFGERTHHLDLFGGKTYIEKPKAKKSAAERKREAQRNRGQTSFDVGLTRSLFG